MRSTIGPAIVGLLLAPVNASAQSEPLGREEFLEASALAAERYADRREAILDGYRRVGPDFPGMGVHWVHTGRVVSGELRGDRPPVLCYVQLGGEPKLVGLAYTLPLSVDESPPAEPFGTDVWHDHSSGVTEESLLLEHPSSMAASDAAFRLAMVHVWLPLTNPDGTLAQNNWTIPFLRSGLEPPPRPDRASARGLSLGAMGVDYYRELLYWAAPADRTERAAIDSLLASKSAEVDAWIHRHRDGWRGEVPDDELARIWDALWEGLERSLDEETYERIRPLRGG